jgi:hypothetical protein
MKNIYKLSNIVLIISVIGLFVIIFNHTHFNFTNNTAAIMSMIMFAFLTLLGFISFWFVSSNSQFWSSLESFLNKEVELEKRIEESKERTQDLSFLLSASSSYFSSSVKKYIDRLIQEWTQHGKIIIGVDFDDTISPWKMNDNDTYSRVIDLLKIAKQTGAYIVIFSACDKNRYDDIKKYCKESGLDIDAINKNPIDLPYGNMNKIYANIFIDDRAGLNEALTILETAMYNVRGMQHGLNEGNQF